MTLREYLRREAMTPPAFARRIGVSPASVWRYLHGLRTPSHDVMRAIRHETRGLVTANDLLDLPRSAAVRRAPDPDAEPERQALTA